jgi:LPXTG-motif cell wall-anchored protein
MTVEERETTFVLTNTLTQDTPPPTPPQTGDTSNIMLWVILMIVFGSVLVILGITGKRSHV